MGDDATPHSTLKAEGPVKVEDSAAESPILSIDALTIEEGTPMGCLSRITLEEIAPDCDKISTKANSKSQSCSKMTVCLKSSFDKEVSDKKLPKNVRRYYKQQQQLADAFHENFTGDDNDLEDQDERHKKSVRRVVLLSLFCNLLLVIGKSFASYLSGSLSIISSLVDSAMVWFPLSSFGTRIVQ